MWEIENKPQNQAHFVTVVSIKLSKTDLCRNVSNLKSPSLSFPPAVLKFRDVRIYLGHCKDTGRDFYVGLCVVTLRCKVYGS